ncbi:hypothetical protein [Microvirga subterranea]|uniref:Uncharacterized protein n=1 Tax=Microvirga subterranea TaxID=186651 RepID=A0A370HVP0_9HYPH|nr:hypothetical protein [Microvirga subterranea]RDI62011.1 hypothetical protein DES45_101272 [Microvirga subterranea]
MRIKRVHLFYWLGICVTIIITLLSNDLSKKDDIYNVLSFALTFSSLILAIIAIIQTLVANNSSAAVLTAIQGAADQTHSASNQIRFTANELRKQVQEIPSRLDEISGKVDRTHSAIDAFATSRLPKEDEADKTAPDGDQLEDAKKYLRRCTVGGVVAWYAINKSLELDVEVDIFSLLDDEKLNNYLAGCIAIYRAHNAVEYDKKGSKIKVTKINHDFGGQLYVALSATFDAAEKKGDTKLLTISKGQIDRSLGLSTPREVPDDEETDE